VPGGLESASEKHYNKLVKGKDGGVRTKGKNYTSRKGSKRGGGRLKGGGLYKNGKISSFSKKKKKKDIGWVI